jgi:hypothetical protein
LTAALLVLAFGVLRDTGMAWATVATALVFGCFPAAGGIVYIVGRFSRAAGAASSSACSPACCTWRPA